jgi:SSS family solute:Na+ symporter
VVSNTVFTYDIWQSYVRRDRSDQYYIRVGRLATVAGVIVGIGTAFIAAGFSNIMNYIQALFSVFNAPLFATFIVGMFWKRMSAWAGFWSLLAGTVVALGTYCCTCRRAEVQLRPVGELLGRRPGLRHRRDRRGRRDAGDAPEPDEDLRGLVYGPRSRRTRRRRPGVVAQPVLLGLVAVVLSFLFYIPSGKGARSWPTTNS